MGTQQQTPESGTEKTGRSGEQKKRRTSGQDAADVPRSENDLGGEEAREGTREDAAGSASGKSPGN